MRTRISLLLLCISLTTVAAFAHGNQRHVMGTVKAISGNSITVRTTGKTPKDVTVLVVASTQFMKSGAAASLQDLKIGDRVVIHAKPNGDKLEASMVDFGKPTMGKMNHWLMRTARPTDAHESGNYRPLPKKGQELRFYCTRAPQALRGRLELPLWTIGLQNGQHETQ
jgi:hypothetical protein